MGKTKTKPVIGITPGFDSGDHFYANGQPERDVHRIYVRREYMDVLSNIGAMPFVLSPEMSMDDILELVDGVIISGGEDIAPSLYGAELLKPERLLEPPERFRWETKLVDACDEAEIPILGICYGMQLLNVHYGGTLAQDIDSYWPDNIGHYKTMHDITFIHEFLGMREKGVHTINARHHQAIDRLAKGFKVSAEAPDGIVEAIEGHGHFGIQWHPESDETGAHIYRAFVEHCTRNWDI